MLLFYYKVFVFFYLQYCKYKKKYNSKWFQNVECKKLNRKCFLLAFLCSNFLKPALIVRGKHESMLKKKYYTWIHETYHRYILKSHKSFEMRFFCSSRLSSLSALKPQNQHDLVDGSLFSMRLDFCASVFVIFVF